MPRRWGFAYASGFDGVYAVSGGCLTGAFLGSGPALFVYCCSAAAVAGSSIMVGTSISLQLLLALQAVEWRSRSRQLLDCYRLAELPGSWAWAATGVHGEAVYLGGARPAAATNLQCCLPPAFDGRRGLRNRC
ncbi:hypothetical protein U9M48_022714 [Paspalum notatum var. saurae]|uniref:Uncharacterized protein n=1 Tax=Paspalum notatum var. saurae TaxID=547442 RepID=A0AAQ3WV32_PASNO